MLHFAMVAILVIAFINSKSDVVYRVSRLSPWLPSRIQELNNFSNSEFPCYPDPSDQVLAQSDFRFRRRCCLKNFKMAAILDIGTEKF